MSVDVAQLKTVAFDAIDKNSAALQELSKAIWDKPELCFEEHTAHDLLTTFLEKQGFNVQRHYILPTAFRATFGEGPGPVVAMLCEYDALPGIGHACGHNLIAELGVAGGLGIKAALEAIGKNVGKVYVIGTPAEEGKGGKILLIEGGAFADVDVALMAHPAKRNTVLPITPLCNIRVTVKFHGKASHASAYPWDGINALDAAVLAYNNVSVLRQQFKPKWRVHGIISNGGTKPNIIPEQTELQYYLRTPTRRDQNELKHKFINCMQSAAAATGCTVDFEWGERPYLCVLTNRTLADIYSSNVNMAGKILTPAEQIQESGGASTDFGNVSYVVPGLHPCFRITDSASEHTREFATAAGEARAHEATLIEAKCLAATALDIFTNPQLLTLAKETFAADVAADS